MYGMSVFTRSLVPRAAAAPNPQIPDIPELSWIKAEARGQLFQGKCFQVACQQLTDLKLGDFDMLPYYGMYDPTCSCRMCADRQWKAAGAAAKAGVRAENLWAPAPMLPLQVEVEVKEDTRARRVRLVNDNAPDRAKQTEIDHQKIAECDAEAQKSQGRNLRLSKDAQADRGRLVSHDAPGRAQRLRRDALSSENEFDEQPKFGEDCGDDEWLPRDAPSAGKKPKLQGAEERYAVRRPIFNDILTRLGAPEPSVDAFADAELHLLSKWWGPGSSTPDSFAADWSSEELLWCNPPFSRLQDVVDKIIKEEARGILILPHWSNQKYFQDIQKYIVKKFLYPVGTRFFERPDQAVNGIKWPVWAIFFDAKTKKQDKDYDMEGLSDEEFKFKPTKASRRRWRRKFKAEDIC